MKTIAFIASLCAFLQVHGQSVLVLQVDDQYIFADTSGKIRINERFDDVDLISDNYNTYKVFKKGKKGIVRDYQILIPAIYNQISVVMPNSTNHAYILRQDQFQALANSRGKMLSSFEYDGIEEFEIERQRWYSKTNYFLFRQGKQRKLASLDENNNFRFEIDTVVERIVTYQGCVVAFSRNKVAMYQLESLTGHLIKRFPFREVSYEFYEGSFYVIDAKANKVQQYNYECKLLRTLKGTTKVPEIPEVYESVIGPPVEVAEVEENSRYNSIDLTIYREQIRKGNYTRMIKDYQEEPTSDLVIKQQWAYFGLMETSGNKGAISCNVLFEYGEKIGLRDTSFVVNYDEVLAPVKEFRTVVAVRKGKKWGLIDVLGREVLPPVYSEVRVFDSDLRNEFIEARTQEQSFLFYHDVKQNTLDTLLVGEAKDQYTINRDQILVKRFGKKRKIYYGKTLWMRYPSSSTFMKAIPIWKWYDSIVSHPAIPQFYQCYLNGKVGLMYTGSREPVAPKYDSLNVNICFYVQTSRYAPFKPLYEKLQPIILAYKNGALTVYAYNGHHLESAAIAGAASNQFTVSNDGLFLINHLGNNQVDIFNLSGKKLSKSPFFLSERKAPVVQFCKKYWFVQGTNASGQDILVGQNGALFVLPGRE